MGYIIFCRISVIAIDSIDNHRFQFLKSVARRYEGNNIGEKGLQIVVKALENALVEKGFVTSRIRFCEDIRSRGAY